MSDVTQSKWIYNNNAFFSNLWKNDSKIQQFSSTSKLDDDDDELQCISVTK